MAESVVKEEVKTFDPVAEANQLVDTFATQLGGNRVEALALAGDLVHRAMMVRSESWWGARASAETDPNAHEDCISSQSMCRVLVGLTEEGVRKNYGDRPELVTSFMQISDRLATDKTQVEQNQIRASLNLMAREIE